MVRPVGLSDDNARDWLRVAAGEVSGIHADLLELACAEARRTCTHHGQIVPTIIKHSAEWMSLRKQIERTTRMAEEEAERRRRQQDLPAPEPWQPTQAELDELKAKAARDLSA